MIIRFKTILAMRDGGVQDGYLGTNYQFKLLTELEEAEKFDDVILAGFV
jgi:hypothetical protein